MDIGSTWQFLENILTADVDKDGSSVTWKSVQTGPQLREAALLVGQGDLSQLLEDWLDETLLQDISKRVSPTFWRYFQSISNASEDSEANAFAFSEAFYFLHDIFTKYYVVALQRLQWLKILAASAPQAVQAVSKSSAFTPVRVPCVRTKANFGNLAHSLALSSTGTTSRGETGYKTDTGRLSVTFEEGTKGEEAGMQSAEEIGMQLGEESLEGEAFNLSWAVGDVRGKRIDSMDGSYVQGVAHQMAENTSHNMASFSSEPEGNLSKNNPALISALVEEDDDEFESFIRSPIGGKQKLGAASVLSHSVSVDSKTPTSAPTAKPSLNTGNSSASTLRALSLTSTPGTALHLTPGALTPIACEGTPTDLASNSPEISTLLLDTPSIQPSGPAHSMAPGSPSSLPDASVVFGVPVSSRPIPTGTVRWPGMMATKCAGSAISNVQAMIRAVLFCSFPQHFATIVKDFYTQAFESHRKQIDGSGVDDEIEESQKKLDEINKKLDDLGLMELVSGAAVTEIVHCQVEKHIEEECRGNFDTSYLRELEEWLDQQVLGWLKQIYACQQTEAQLASVDAFRERLRHFIYETYAKSLISQFFDIIIDYPDSKPAILDLKNCLERTDLRPELVASLKSALENRLLHPGVNTADILTAYIAAIKSLRLLEPAGVILEVVCEPVGRYLRSREDTVRCIVASLTDEGNNELVQELVNTKPVAEDDVEEEGNMAGWEDWVPDPVDADPSSMSKSRRSADILSTLVNIYGSKELFVSEYRALLADRILTQYNYDVERELRYLELLKLRFGEAQLHFCEVMLRDVTESRRVNARIQETKRGQDRTAEVDINAMILSAQFWPAFREEKIKVPQELQTHMDMYTRAFELQKQNRTLIWKPHLGMMNIELELKEETLNLSVSPVQAAIIIKFQTKSTWTIEDLSADLEMAPSVLRRKITFWQGQGLLRESAPDVYQLIEERRSRGHDLVVVDEEEVESAMASAQQQKEEEMQIFWTYIQGMLANLDCLTLERIHSMLRMFAMEESSSSEVSVQELKHFLDNKVKDQVLLFSGGVYRLNK